MPPADVPPPRYRGRRALAVIIPLLLLVNGVAVGRSLGPRSTVAPVDHVQSSPAERVAVDPGEPSSAADKPLVVPRPSVDRLVLASGREAPEPPSPAPAPPPAPAQDAAGPERVPLVRAEPRLAAFAGLSTWVDVYDDALTPAEQAARAAAGGVQTIFVQTARFNSPGHIHDPARLAALIEAAHDHGLQVMVWYIPDFVDLERDYHRSQAAMAFVTPRGDRPDAFGLDIETEFVPDAAERSARLVVLSQALRRWVGPDYPMAAIVLPPLQLDLRPSWWPAFPYAELTAYYDVFIPMSYSSFRGTDADLTYRWNLGNVLELRRRSGDPNLPIHLAGGIADRLSEVPAFVAAARDGAVVGAGLYDLHTTPATSWGPLQALRTE